MSDQQERCYVIKQYTAASTPTIEIYRLVKRNKKGGATVMVNGFEKVIRNTIVQKVVFSTADAIAENRCLCEKAIARVEKKLEELRQQMTAPRGTEVPADKPEPIDTTKIKF